MKSEEAGSLPGISIVVCAYNEQKLLQQCLSSLIDQKYENTSYEVIIVDDESSDETPEIAETFIQQLDEGQPAFRYLRIKHGGLSIARNTGIASSRYEIIAFIDGDAIAKPDWLHQLAARFAAGADFVGGRIELLNTKSEIAQFAQRTRHRQFFGPDVFGNAIIGCNMAYRREVFTRFGGFYENFDSRGDESSLKKKIGKTFEFGTAENAVVLHERPETLKSWLRTEGKAAVLSGLIAKASYRNSPKEWIAVFEHVLVGTLPLFVLFAYFDVAGFVITGLSGLALFRQCFVRAVNRKILNGLIDRYGAMKGVLGHLLYCYMSSLFHGYGRLMGAWVYQNHTLIEPNTTEVQILSEKSNRKR